MCFQLRSTFEKIVGQYCVCGASRLKINFFFSFRLGLDILKIRWLNKKAKYEHKSKIEERRLKLENKNKTKIHDNSWRTRTRPKYMTIVTELSRKWDRSSWHRQDDSRPRRNSDRRKWNLHFHLRINYWTVCFRFACIQVCAKDVQMDDE